jgi:hypothetical protein
VLKCSQWSRDATRTRRPEDDRWGGRDAGVETKEAVMTRRISPGRLCREVAYLNIELQKERMNSYDRR